MRCHCLPGRVAQRTAQIGTQEILSLVRGLRDDLEKPKALCQVAEIALEIDFGVNRVQSGGVILTQRELRSGWVSGTGAADQQAPRACTPESFAARLTFPLLEPQAVPKACS